MEKLHALMKRLGGRSASANATEEKYQKGAETALKVWLEVETLYRMSEEKYDELEESSQFALQHLQVAEAVEKLTQKDVAQVIREYPGKKGEVNEEKELVMDIIQMVEKINFGSTAAKGESAQLQYLKAQIASITG